MKKAFVTVALIMLIFQLGSCKKKEEAKEIQTGPPEVGDIAPEFTLKDIKGNTVSLSAYRGRVVLIEFWATWCAPCKTLTPVLTELYERYKDRGFVILGLASDNEDAIRSFVNAYGMKYPVLLADNSTVRQYGVTSIPASFILNREGRIVAKHLGDTPGIMHDLSAEIEKLL